MSEITILDSFIGGALLVLVLVMVVWFSYTITMDKVEKMIREEVKERLERHKDIYHDK